MSPEEAQDLKNTWGTDLWLRPSCTWKTLKEISGVASLFKLQETLVVALAVLCYCDLPSVIRVSITDPEPWAHAACLTFAGNDQ